MNRQDVKKPVVTYTAKITLPSGEIIEKEVSSIGDFPSLEDFDLSTREGFLEDFDQLEKTILKTGRELNSELSKAFLEASSKKKQKTRVKGTSLDSEIGRINFYAHDIFADSLQPKERVLSLSFLEAASCVCIKTSYRDAAEILNHFLGRTSETTIKLRTLSDCMCRVGNEVTQKLSNITAQTLRMYGFDKESGLPREDVTLAETVTSICESSNIEIDKPKIIAAVDAVNQSREEKIQIPVEEVKIESTPSECIYISIDDIGVKHQKDFRKEGSVREYKFVENTVAYIQYADKSCVLTGIGMQNVFKSVLAFLLANNLLSHELVFLTDGAKDIKGYIDSIFQFHPYSVILDWYHLKKRCQERLSQSIRGKDKRNVVLEKLLRYLWVGDVSGATTFLTHLKPEEIKSQKWRDDLLGYLARKSYAIPCYAVRAKLGLKNSSHAVEKANDILIAQRQKHNGMAWSPNGSGALASLQMIYLNNQQDLWFRKKELLFCDFFKNVKKAA